MDLECKELNCEHNKCCSCTCKDIKVNEKCECEAYKRTNGNSNNYDISNHMFEAGFDAKNHKLNDKVKVYCSANCLFNNSGICSANGININNKDATCVTAIKK